MLYIVCPEGMVYVELVLLKNQVKKKIVLGENISQDPYCMESANLIDILRNRLK